MNAIYSRYHSMLFSSEVNINGSKCKKLEWLAARTMRAGIELGLFFASIGAIAVYHTPLISKRISYQRQNMPILIGAIIFAGCLFISAIIVIVKSINFCLIEKAKLDVLKKEKEEKVQERQRAEQELEDAEIGQKWAAGVYNWRTDKNIESLLKSLEEAPPYLDLANIKKTEAEGKSAGAEKKMVPEEINDDELEAIIETIGEQNYTTRTANRAIHQCLIDACFQYENLKNKQPKENALISKIYEIMLSVGINYLKQAETINSEPHKYHFYVAASRWLTKPAQMLPQALQELKNLKAKNLAFADLEKRISHLTQAAGLYCFLIETEKFKPDEQTLNTVPDFLMAALDQGNAFAKYALALSLIKQNKLEDAKLKLEELLKIEKQAGIDLGNLAKSTLANTDIFGRLLESDLGIDTNLPTEEEIASPTPEPTSIPKPSVYKFKGLISKT